MLIRNQIGGLDKYLENVFSDRFKESDQNLEQQNKIKECMRRNSKISSVPVAVMKSNQSSKLPISITSIAPKSRNKNDRRSYLLQ
jgi:hypothetical protein